jgi:uncharacterized protein YdeI (YjbR/CyaY-like superfamily)
MSRRDPRIDAYIDKAAPFAKPILTHLRETVHAACPDCEETLKWGHPSFTYKGLMCGMAAFKQHCTFGFWKGSLVLGRGKDGDAMGQFGRITSLQDLPSASVIAGYVKKAAALNDAGVTTPRAPRGPARAVRVPPDLAAALKKHKKAKATFDNFSASHRREYVEWITDAKRDETRKRRLATTIAWLTEGKTHNWRYESR